MVCFVKNNLLFNQNNLQDSLHSIFETLVRSQPNAKALIWKDEALTYSDLNRISSAMAFEMIKRDVKRGSYIPIILPRHPKLIISLIAVLKTGSAYALLDQDWPKDRLREVIKSLNPPLVITNIDSLSITEILIWNPFKDTLCLKQKDTNCEVEPVSPCCLFFTSGTTGKPKGVISPHSGITRLFKDNSIATFCSKTVIPLAAALPWDAFSLELWGALLNGGTSWIIDEPYLSTTVLRKGILEYGVNTTWMTSSLFNMIVEEDIGAFTGLTQLMIGGEKLSTSHVKTFLENYINISLINGYGPVESTVFATTHNVSLNDCDNPNGIPIGVPVTGTEVYVLDNQEQLCEEGQIGEICIAGDGLAIAYHNDPILTDQKFKKVNINGIYSRIYTTGDLGFWSNGLLHFQGREDRQVKIRGHRVELTEIERQIEKVLTDVKSCRVIAKKDESKLSQELIAFCIPKKKGDKLEKIRDNLESKVVHYQLPAAVISIESFPLTTQGKLDERKLLEIYLSHLSKDLNAFTTHNKNVKPNEKIVREVFSSVLGKNFVPSDISLKELGGNSLDIGRICSRLGSKFNRVIPLSLLYQYPTIASLSHFLNISSNDPFVPSYSANNNMNPMQLMYLTQHLVNPENLSSRCLMTWFLNGNLDLILLKNAISYVHKKNEALRTHYLADTNPNLKISESFAPSLIILPNQSSIVEANMLLRSELSGVLDPTQGQIWRTAVVQIGESRRSIFGCAIHHIAFDGYSEHLLANDLSEGYKTLTRGNEKYYPCSNLRHVLTPSSLNGCINNPKMSFIKEFENVPEINWPKPEKINAPYKDNNKEYSVSISRTLVKKIDEFAIINHLSRFDILFHHWAKTLQNATKQDDFCIGVPIRQRNTLESENLLGCYLNMICIRLRKDFFSNGGGFKETSQAIQCVLANQDVSFLEVLQLVKHKQTGRTPLFQTLFALQDNPAPELNLAGLKTKFIRQPYLDLPLELHAEIWPDNNDALLLNISHRQECLSSELIPGLANSFIGSLNQFLNISSGAYV
jgi:mycobactin peptide synthetase MbtE